MTLADFLTAAWKLANDKARELGWIAWPQQPLNIGKEWSKNELFSLRNRIEHERSVAHIATFLMRTETEIREKAAELGLTLPE